MMIIIIIYYYYVMNIVLNIDISFIEYENNIHTSYEMVTTIIYKNLYPLLLHEYKFRLYSILILIYYYFLIVVVL